LFANEGRCYKVFVAVDRAKLERFNAEKAGAHF
jgi:hypothetical protein